MVNSQAISARSQFLAPDSNNKQPALWLKLAEAVASATPRLTEVTAESN